MVIPWEDFLLLGKCLREICSEYHLYFEVIFMKIIYAYIKKETNEYKYIGQTNNLSFRIWQHKYDSYREGRKEYEYPLSRALRKYGESAFEIKILEENLTKKEADEREIYWIRYYDTCFKGYN